MSLECTMDSEEDCSKFWPETTFSKKVFLHSIVEADKREKELERYYHVCESKDILHSCDKHGHSKVILFGSVRSTRIYNLCLYGLECSFFGLHHSGLELISPDLSEVPSHFQSPSSYKHTLSNCRSQKYFVLLVDLLHLVFFIVLSEV